MNQKSKGLSSTAILLIVIGSIAALVVIVVVVGVVAAVAIPSIVKSKNNSMRLQTQAEMKTISNALQIYALEKRDFPAVDKYSDLQQVLVPTYLDQLPPADPWGQPYLYVTDQQDGYYLLGFGQNRMQDLYPPYRENAKRQIGNDDFLCASEGFLHIPDGKEY